MTQKTKLEIIGPYTPEHEGPFCTRDGQTVRLITHTEGNSEFPIVGIVENDTGTLVWDNAGSFFGKGQRDDLDLMNAREVPVARDFWVNEYRGVFGNVFGRAHISGKEAMEIGDGRGDYLRTIHVREVLLGEE